MMASYVAAAMSCLFACKPSTPVSEDSAIVNLVDLTEMIDRYHRAQDSIAQIEEDKETACLKIMEGCDIQKYREPSPDDDYAFLEIPQFQHESLEAWVTAYNALVSNYDMTSLYELWARSEWAGGDVEPAVVSRDIAGFRTDIPLTDSVRVKLRNAQSEASGFIINPAKDATAIAKVRMAWDDLNDCLNAQLDQLYGAPDSVRERCLPVTLFGWREIREQPSWKALESIEDESERIEAFFKMMQEASTFEQQSQIALASYRVIPCCILAPTMRFMLGSGQYSKYQFALWFGWRSMMQVNYFGLSRDSTIADGLYNQYRKAAFLATLLHFDQNTADELANTNLLLFASYSNIVRNGSCIVGSDAILDEELIFGDDD